MCYFFIVAWLTDVCLDCLEIIIACFPKDSKKLQSQPKIDQVVRHHNLDSQQIQLASSIYLHDRPVPSSETALIVESLKIESFDLGCFSSVIRALNRHQSGCF